MVEKQKMLVEKRGKTMENRTAHRFLTGLTSQTDRTIGFGQFWTKIRGVLIFRKSEYCSRTDIK
ncbi:unnamed protein product [Acanthoscelides obtectus]|uniref:Uncharacterized protein n=1 Tax=Acanthoscelides obtectus TaxID=200917 RepID=A0A9P0KXX8_ACAOB|nr:unnamed protein product [Acanthoscelides obtectus]CAK1626315.1 hypothetical protein AOBTE_LOCUS3771 [Acanthoscelides obtectus]